MSENSSRLGFEKLNDTNYIEWSIRMEAELVRAGLWLMVEIQLDNIDGKDAATISAKLEVKKGKRSWEKMAQARAEIILCVEGSQLDHMRDKDPMAIWETLRQETG